MSNPVTSVGEDFPRQQARVRELLETYRTLHKPPATNCVFAMATCRMALEHAEQAQASGDILQILAAYQALTEIE